MAPQWKELSPFRERVIPPQTSLNGPGGSTPMLGSIELVGCIVDLLTMMLQGSGHPLDGYHCHNAVGSG